MTKVNDRKNERWDQTFNGQAYQADDRISQSRSTIATYNLQLARRSPQQYSQRLVQYPPLHSYNFYALALGNTVAAYEVVESSGTTSIDAREYSDDIEARDYYGTLQTRDFGELDTRELNEFMEVFARLVEDYELSTRDVESDHQLYTRQKKGKGAAAPKRNGGGGGGGGGNTRVNIDPGSVLHGAGHLSEHRGRIEAVKTEDKDSPRVGINKE
ncbi:hypothetical protein B0H34DRAFT_807632 [Crassisporium funariophilum]|nr:hypothetical protein B0H34DRAFT_807632 [Crassisporium funariophilum]